MKLLGLLLAILLVQLASAKTYPEAEWKARFTRRPFPDYPRWVRARRLVGNGVFRMQVDEQGRVAAVTVLKSTGHKELDSLATKALFDWRGRPGQKWSLDMPINFTMDMNVHPRNPANEKTYR
jgi:TonB family protein